MGLLLLFSSKPKACGLLHTFRPLANRLPGGSNKKTWLNLPLGRTWQLVGKSQSGISKWQYSCNDVQAHSRTTSTINTPRMQVNNFLAKKQRISGLADAGRCGHTFLFFLPHNELQLPSGQLSVPSWGQPRGRAPAKWPRISAQPASGSIRLHDGTPSRSPPVSQASPAISAISLGRPVSKKRPAGKSPTRCHSPKTSITLTMTSTISAEPFWTCTSSRKLGLTSKSSAVLSLTVSLPSCRCRANGWSTASTAA